MKAFVTGATGNLGRPLIEELLLRGWSVDAFVLPEEDADLLTQGGVAVFRGDITDRASIDRAIKESVPDLLFHLAAYVKLGVLDSRESQERMYDVNVSGTRNVLESALQRGVKKAVYLSSVAAFGSSGQEDIITEDTSPCIGNPVGEYGRTKLLAYQEAMSTQKQGLPLLVFMPGIVFGPGISGMVSLLGSAYEGKVKYLPDSSDEARIPLVFNPDVLEAIFAGVERNKFGEKYILCESIPFPQLLVVLAEVAGKEMNFRYISYRKALLLAWLAEAFSKLTGKAPRITRDRVRNLFRVFRYSQQFDSSKARRELDWRPTPLKDACRETVAWFLENCVEQQKRSS